METETAEKRQHALYLEKTKHTLLYLLASRKGDEVRGMDKYLHMTTCAHMVRVGYDDVGFYGPSLKSEFVVAALFHDVFGALAPLHHAMMIAKVIGPIVPKVVHDTLFYHDEMMKVHWYPELEDGWQFRANKAKTSTFKYMRWFADEIDHKSFSKRPFGCVASDEFAPELDEVFSP